MGINDMFADKNIKLIFCLSGGFNSNSTFEYLDYDIIKNESKTNLLDLVIAHHLQMQYIQKQV